MTRDGEIGKVDDFYFDDQTWTMRYTIVKMEEGLRGRRVLMATEALVKDDEDASSVQPYWMIFVPHSQDSRS